jgi:hypothetical protein
MDIEKAASVARAAPCPIGRALNQGGSTPTTEIILKE